MDKEKIIKWLERAEKLEKKIAYNENQIIVLESQARKATSNPSQALGNTTTGRNMENCSTWIIDITEELKKLYPLLPVVKEEVSKAIQKIATTKYRDLLIRRHLNYEKWGDIADILGYSEDHVRGYLYKQAIEVISMYVNTKMLKVNTENTKNNTCFA